MGQNLGTLFIESNSNKKAWLEYACQRLYRDARITSIYEGTTQLQTVAALPHINTGTYSQMLEELEAGEVATEYESLKARAKAMDAKFNEAIEVVKAANNNEFTDLCSRHLYAVTPKVTRINESCRRE